MKSKSLSLLCPRASCRSPWRQAHLEYQLPKVFHFMSSLNFSVCQTPDSPWTPPWLSPNKTELVAPSYWKTLHAAAAAKLLQSCLTLCDPIDSSPPGFPIPGILQARILEWVALSFSNAWKWKVNVKSLSCDPVDCSPLVSSIHGIFQARVLEWGAIVFSAEQVRMGKCCKLVWDYL